MTPPWWQQGARIVTPSTVVYEGATDFDAFVPTEILMLGQEVRDLHICGFSVAADTEIRPHRSPLSWLLCPQPPRGTFDCRNGWERNAPVGVGVGEIETSRLVNPFCDWGVPLAHTSSKLAATHLRQRVGPGLSRQVLLSGPHGLRVVWHPGRTAEAQNPASCRRVQARSGGHGMSLVDHSTEHASACLQVPVCCAVGIVASQAATVLPNQNAPSAAHRRRAAGRIS